MHAVVSFTMQLFCCRFIGQKREGLAPRRPDISARPDARAAHAAHENIIVTQHVLARAAQMAHSPPAHSRTCGRTASRAHLSRLLARLADGQKGSGSNACAYRARVIGGSLPGRNVTDRTVPPTPASPRLRMRVGRRLPASGARIVTHGRRPSDSSRRLWQETIHQPPGYFYMYSPRSTFETSS
jgi:hypothetical protein